MLFSNKRNENETLNNDSDKMKPVSFADMTYDGQPIPTWLQEPAFESQTEEDQEESLPEWLQDPADFC